MDTLYSGPDTKGSYDTVAETYAQRLATELDQKPFDRKILDMFVERSPQQTTLCDMGCGPGHIAHYIQGHHRNVIGVDFSEAMLNQAHALFPNISYVQDDMTRLEKFQDNSLGGIAAFYSIVHFSKNELEQSLTQFHRVLLPNGVALITFHIGTEIRHMDELWGHPVNMDFHFFEVDAVTCMLEQTGFVVDEAILRNPYPEAVEVQTQRAYIFAHKP